jgi:circadian clock protein KaiB
MSGRRISQRSVAKEYFLPGKIAEAKQTPAGPHQLRLYVAGSGVRSLRAVQNLKRVCDSEIPGMYRLEVVDIYKEPRRATEDQIIAIPTLIKQAPGAEFRMVGDLSEIAQVRRGLGL